MIAMGNKLRMTSDDVNNTAFLSHSKTRYIVAAYSVAYFLRAMWNAKTFWDYVKFVWRLRRAYAARSGLSVDLYC